MMRQIFSTTRKPRAPRRGFTLIEAALVTAIISIGVVAMLELLAKGTISNGNGAEQTTAMNLAKNIREMTFGMAPADPTTPTNWGVEAGETTAASYDDIDDLDGVTFSPPIDARRQPLSAYSNWSQTITVRTVDPNRLTLTVPNGTAGAMRITCQIKHNGKDVGWMSWIAFDPE
jgi:prepilin-type N-terminal cleavage/methylation domain-containing protein